MAERNRHSWHIVITGMDRQTGECSSKGFGSSPAGRAQVPSESSVAARLNALASPDHVLETSWRSSRVRFCPARKSPRPNCVVLGAGKQLRSILTKGRMHDFAFVFTPSTYQATTMHVPKTECLVYSTCHSTKTVG